MRSLAAELRRTSALRLSSVGTTAKNLPLFGFVGIAFSARNDISNQADKEDLFAQIRELHSLYSKPSSNVSDFDLSLATLEIGPLIGKGCNAAVHEARLQLTDVCNDDDDISILPDVEPDQFDLDPDTVVDREADTIDLDPDTEMAPLEFEDDAASDISILDEDLDEDEDKRGDTDLIAEHLHMDLLLAEYGTEFHADENSDVEEAMAGPDMTFDLAVKVMFNYDVESNATAVAQAMTKETLPLSLAALHQDMETWRNGNRVKNKYVPPHPNIVQMFGMFVDSLPDLPSSIEHYPDALPTRLNPEGSGRNMTMFLVMKRYSCTLSDYLAKENPSIATRCLLLAQLLEGVVFLSRHGIAHRDLKSDNLLLDLSDGPDSPVLVISDFGCCLCENGLRIRYETSEISKGGNAALMAPEIACAEVGKGSVLDYTKADVWAVGAIALEIFGQDNPFYRSRTNLSRLDSRTYAEDDLPSLPEEVPEAVKSLIRNMLSRDQTKRVSARVSATILQLCLWSPVEWAERKTGSSLLGAVQDWVVAMAAQLACYANTSRGLYKDVRSKVKQTFLSRISHSDLKSAVLFLEDV